MSQRQRDAPKIGDQTLKAMASLGLEELRNAAYAQSNVAQHSVEPGMYGDRSYGDVSADRTEGVEPERKSLLAEKIKQAEVAHDGRGQQPPELCQE
ncbi:MAG: hypothetical protein JWM57_998 [Phycisphaerales bacterium]|nr:hypothetical protein [Phycisphaerales bacterium]